MVQGTVKQLSRKINNQILGVKSVKYNLVRVFFFNAPCLWFLDQCVIVEITMLFAQRHKISLSYRTWETARRHQPFLHDLKIESLIQLK